MVISLISLAYVEEDGLLLSVALLAAKSALRQQQFGEQLSARSLLAPCGNR
jgi:hypothetical protein